MAKIILFLLGLVNFSAYPQSSEQKRLETLFDGLSLTTSNLGFKKLNGTTDSNFMVKKNGVPLFNLKCTHKNSFHKAAIVVYELGKILDIDLYPVARPVFVNQTIKYHHKVNNSIQDATVKLNEECVIKEWIKNFAPYYWIIDKKTQKNTFSNSRGNKHKLTESLRCDSGNLDNSDFIFYSNSENASPDASIVNPAAESAIYLGTNSLEEASKDFSNMLLMDAIIGNDDRFPGGNIHFKDQDRDIEVRNGRVLFHEAKFFSIDNESSLRGHKSNAMVYFKKYITRFDRRTIFNLVNLRSELKSALKNKKLNEKYPFLNFSTWKTNAPLVPYLLQNIDEILKHVESTERKCGVLKTYI